MGLDGIFSYQRLLVEKGRGRAMSEHRRKDSGGKTTVTSFR